MKMNHHIGGKARARKAKGRPREFDLDKALDAAVAVFWTKGYEGTTLPDLTRAMRISRPSLYAAFGNKESLFRKVIDRYLERGACDFANALAAPKVRDAVQRLLSLSLSETRGARSQGCLLINGALACADESEPIRRELAQRRMQTESAVRARLDQAVIDGELPATADVRALAKFISTFKNGLAVQQAGGARGAELLMAVNVAMKAVDAQLK